MREVSSIALSHALAADGFPRGGVSVGVSINSVFMAAEASFEATYRPA
jgi:hypothetical protein